MKKVIQLDSAGYFAGFTTADESPLEPGVFLLPGGAVDAPVPVISEGQRAKWEGSWVVEDIPAPEPDPDPDPEIPLVPEYTQFEKDQHRYHRRAAAKDSLIAWMAADNMSRVRAGVWTVADLQALLVDLAQVNAMMQTLSFELAAQAIAASANPLMTPDIKTAWVSKLNEHFYIDT